MLKHIVHSVKQYSIRNILILCLVTLIILPLLTTAYVIHHEASKLMSQQVHENQLQVLNQSQINIKSFLNEIDKMSVAFLCNDAVQEYCNYYTDTEKPSHFQFPVAYQEEKQHLLNIMIETAMDLTASKNYIYSISIHKGNKLVFQHGATTDPDDFRYQAAAESLQGRGYWTPVYSPTYGYNTQEEGPVISYIRSIRDLDTSKNLAIEKFTIKERNLSDIYSNSQSGMEPRLHTYILDWNGEVISSDDKEVLGKKLPAYDQLQKKMTKSAGYFKYEESKRESSVFYSYIDETNWLLVQTVPENILNSSLNIINLVIMISIGFCTLFCILYSVIQNRHVVKPIIQLSEEMNKVKKGNFDVQLNIFSHNEIGELSSQFVDMTKQLKNLFETVYRAKIKEREAELIALQMQINPHFLYNTLDSIYWLAYRNKDYVVGEQIEALSNMFKHTLNFGKEMTNIEDELKYLNNYFLIQKSRFGDRIQLEVNADPNVLKCQTLKLILQPLIENSITHGLDQKVNGGIVKLTIRREGSVLMYLVEDDGVGVDSDWINAILNSAEASMECFALKNIHDRIQIRYGDNYGIRFESIVGEGTRVEVRFPIEEEKDMV